MRAHAVVLLVAALAAPVLLAGCTEKVDAAKDQLQEVKQSYEELKARYERVRSMTIVRTERVDLTLLPDFDVNESALTFEPVASRSGVVIPRENLSAISVVSVLPQLAPYAGAPDAVSGPMMFRCDPLTCVVTVPEGGAVLLAWDAADGYGWQVTHDGRLLAHRDGAWAEATREDFAFARGGVSVLATTSAGDATD